MHYNKEQLEKVTEETLDDIAGCCDCWNYIREGNETNDICPDCGRATIDGSCICGCNYSSVICKTCGAAPCDGSC